MGVCAPFHPPVPSVIQFDGLVLISGDPPILSCKVRCTHAVDIVIALEENAGSLALSLKISLAHLGIDLLLGTG
jgi:hypothetical protein